MIVPFRRYSLARTQAREQLLTARVAPGLKASQHVGHETVTELLKLQNRGADG